MQSINSQKERIMEVLCEAKKLAKEYRSLTGKPLGITGESPNTKPLGFSMPELNPGTPGRVRCR